VLKGGFFYASNLVATAYGQTMYVSSDSILVVTGAVSLTKITFDPNTKPKLSLFFGSATVDFSAALENGSPPQFWLYALPSCTYMKLTSQNAFVGVIYAPGMDLSAQGGASVQGAIVAKSFSCQGTFDFHHDDATGGTESKNFKILSWAEL